MKNSYFDGGLLGFYGTRIIGVLLTLVTLGLALPWAICYIKRWETRHTVINGQRLVFDGTGAQLFGNYVKWWFLTLITLGIYGFWVNLKIIQWTTKHTLFELV